MSPDPEVSGSVRSAETVNEQIRALMLRCSGWLQPEDRAEYERLRAEWVEAA
ncbi:hypothetical protein [Streptomyces sp. SD15]